MGKMGAGGMWGQDIPYTPGSPATQQYEQEQKQRTQKKLKLKMQTSSTPAVGFAHQRAAEHQKSFVNFGLANRIHGIPTTKKMRLF